MESRERKRRTRRRQRKGEKERKERKREREKKRKDEGRAQGRCLSASPMPTGPIYSSTAKTTGSRVGRRRRHAVIVRAYDERTYSSSAKTIGTVLVLRVDDKPLSSSPRPIGSYFWKKKICVLFPELSNFRAILKKITIVYGHRRRVVLIPCCRIRYLICVIVPV